MSKMKAAMFESFGEPAKVLTVKQVEIPVPGEGEVRVRMTRAPIHNHDIMTVRGEYGTLPELPAIGGSEAAGTIDALGEGVSGLSKGARIAAAGIEGAWAEYFIAPASSVVPLPDDISDEAGAQLMAMPSSSLMALNKIPAEKGEWIAINAANGAVGKSVAQMALARGLKVASIVNRQAAKDQLNELGVEPVFVAEGDDWVENAKDVIDGHVAGGIEMIGGKAAADLISLMGEGATVLSFGAMSDEPMQIESGEMIFKELILKGFWGLKEHGRATPQQMQQIVGELIGFMQSGKLELPVHQTYTIDQIAQAGEDYYGNRDGKLMIAG